MSTNISPSPTPGLSARVRHAVRRGLWLAVLSALLSGCAGQMPREALPEKPRTDKLNGAINTSMGLVRTNQADVMCSELIIVMRPRIKNFVPQSSEEKTAAKPVIPVTPVAPVSAVAPVIQSPVDTEIEEKAVDEKPAEPPVAAPTQPNLPVSTTPLAGVYVQLGAFVNAGNAENFRQDVDQRLGWRRDSAQNLWVIAPTKDSRLHRVLVGPFASRQAAQAWAERGQRVVGTRPILVIL